MEEEEENLLWCGGCIKGYHRKCLAASNLP